MLIRCRALSRTPLSLPRSRALAAAGARTYPALWAAAEAFALESLASHGSANQFGALSTLPCCVHAYSAQVLAAVLCLPRLFSAGGSPSQLLSARVLRSFRWILDKDSGQLRIPYLQTDLGRALRRYAAQIQPNRLRTAWIQDAFNKFVGKSVESAPSSRTDTGVHALRNVCHVDVERVSKRRPGEILPPHEPAVVKRAVNHFLQIFAEEGMGHMKLECSVELVTSSAVVSGPIGKDDASALWWKELSNFSGKKVRQVLGVLERG
ncbi:hypothetical protein L7F22_014713 [Adiantum nelumboides]|nr:hypothetical protein [Adiantum nelumboides]